MRWFLLAAALVSSPAFAAPTYLDCRFPGAVPIKITADEATGKATVFVPSTGFTETLTAAFTPDEVIFANNMLDYKISRTDLSIDRTVRLLKKTDRGQCKVVEAPPRAF
ncbi:hypothetical protein [Altererythrobacter sp. Root672]|uniref:hypothetical protein n=1 Tax=Altererythrobacter sp. Root672 TaxID=1736584 RepID=UPI0007005C08|nr:hypothetical protein [Altererythrobacter sp. Root672]KRA84182.1 hypothetical protein ASD76_09375 [Altererythrobacter sp. Root672]